MNPQVVQNQEHLSAGILDQCRQKLDQPIRVESLINDHPTCLPLVGHSGNHRQLLSGATDDKGDGGLAGRRIAAAPDIGIDQGRFVTPVDFSPFGFGALLDFRVLLIKPGLYCFRALLIGAAEWLLGCEAPAGQVFADRTDMQLDAVFAFDQLHDGSPIPQGKVHLQLLRPLVADDLPDRLFLVGTQAAPVTGFPAPRCWANCRNPTRLIQIDRFAYRRIAQPRQFNNAHHAMAFAMQPYNLLSPFVQLLQRLISCVFFVHAAVNQKT